jgi:hypothetical protein
MGTTIFSFLCCLFVCVVFVCLCSCSMERCKREESCIYGGSLPKHMVSVGLMYNLSKMMVIPDSAGDAS